MQQLQKYKKTELGDIPEEWDIKKLLDVGRVIGGGTPDTTKKGYWENGNIAWAVPTDLTDLKTNYIDRTNRFITKQGLDNSAARLLPVGTILITSRATIGECAINTIPITTNQGFQSLICNSENDRLFFLYLIKFNKNRLIRKSHGTTFLEISKNNINNLKFSIPPLKEQQKISFILSRVDELIQKTDQIIEQTQRLKKGLMQRLLTKGIGHTKFKKTEFGEIPEKWEIVTVTTVCQGIVPGRNKPKQFNGNIPWITINDIDGMYINESKNGLKVTKEEVKKCSGKIIPANSVVMTCVGELGIVGITMNEVVINQQLHAFVCSNKIIPYFLAIYLVTQKKYMYSVATTTTIPYMNKENCNNISIILPPIEEQQKIASILSRVDELTQREQKEKSKFEVLKRGLIQQLLTGKIRVKV